MQSNLQKNKSSKPPYTEQEQAKVLKREIAKKHEAFWLWYYHHRDGRKMLVDDLWNAFKAGYEHGRTRG